MLALRRMSQTLLTSVCLLSLAGCYEPSVPFPNLPRLSVSAQFGVENLCDIGVSPQISLANVPAGTRVYVVQITNIDVLIQTPWRETIPLTSRTEIPEGAAKTYDGPCIGDNVRFAPLAESGYRYRIEVLAEGAAGNRLAYGAMIAFVQSPYLTARRLRTQLLQGNQPSSPAPQSAPGLQPSGLGSYGGFVPGPRSNFGLMQ